MPSTPEEWYAMECTPTSFDIFIFGFTFEYFKKCEGVSFSMIKFLHFHF